MSLNTYVVLFLCHSWDNAVRWFTELLLHFFCLFYIKKRPASRLHAMPLYSSTDAIITMDKYPFNYVPIFSLKRYVALLLLLCGGTRGVQKPADLQWNKGGRRKKSFADPTGRGPFRSVVTSVFGAALWFAIRWVEHPRWNDLEKEHHGYGKGMEW